MKTIYRVRMVMHGAFNYWNSVRQVLGFISSVSVCGGTYRLSYLRMLLPLQEDGIELVAFDAIVRELSHCAIRVFSTIDLVF